MYVFLTLPRPLYYVFIVTFSALAVVACGKQQGQSSYDYLSQAQQYYQKGEYNSAIIEVKNALQKDPDNGEARYLFAVIHNDMGQGAEAEIELHKARKLGVNVVKVDVALGKAYLLQNKYQKVIDEIKPSEELKGMQASEIYALRGDAYMGLGKEKEANSAYDIAVKSAPDFPDAYLGLARLAESRQDMQEALHQTEAALGKAPNNISAWLMKANVLRLQNKDDAATSAYRHVIQIDNRNVPAHLSLASMALASGDLKEARSELDAAKRIAPKSVQVKYTQALVNFREGKYADARDALQDVMRLAPDYMPGVLLSGVVFYQLGTYEQAHQNLTTFLGQFPGNVYATNLLAATDIQLNQPSDALQNLTPMLTKGADNPQLLALTGEAYLQSKDYAKATEYLEKAASLDTKNAALMAQLGLSRLVSGDTQRALQDLQAAIAIDPNQSKADALLVITHLNKKEYDKALASAQSWEKKQPKNPVAYYLEGGSYVGKVDYVNARKSFMKAVEIKSDYFPAVINLAQLDLRDNDPQSARKRLENFLQYDKTNMRAMVALADVAMESGQEGEAVDWLNKAIQANPSVMRLRGLLVNYYLTKNNYDKALSAARDAVTAKPDDLVALDMLASTQLASGHADDAIRSYKALAHAVPKSAEAWIKLAEAQMAGKDMGGARGSLNQSLQLKPGLLDAELRLSLIDLQEKKYIDAQKRAQQIQRQYPDNPVGEVVEGDVLSVQGQYDSAAKHYRRAYDIRHSGITAVKVHQALTLAGDRAGANKMLNQYLLERPDDLAARAYLADAYLKAGETKGAIRQYQALLKQSPSNVAAMNNLAWLYQQDKDPRALDIAEKAYNLDPSSAGLMDTLGWILVDRGDLKRAVHLLKKATVSAPDNLQIGYHYAAALAKNGNTEEARTELKRIISSGKEFPDESSAKELLNKL